MSIDSQDSVASLVDRAEVLVELSRPAEALELLTRAIASDPGYGYAWCAKAGAHIKAGDYDYALEAAGVAASCMPEDEWPHQLACIALMNLYGREEDAIAAGRVCVQMSPHNWRSHYLLGMALVDVRKHREEAEAAAARGMELAPNDPAVHELAGEVALARRRRDEARAHFERALAIDPDSTGAHEGLARLHLNGIRLPTPSRFASAATGFATTLSVDPTVRENRYNLDLALRTALAWGAYFLFLVAWLVARIAATFDTNTARLIPIAALALPAIFVVRFATKLRPEVRSHMIQQCRRGMFLAAATFDGAAVLLVFASAVAPHQNREALAGLAAIAALIARVALYVEGRSEESRYDIRH